MTDTTPQNLWKAERESGVRNSELYPELGYGKCVNGWIEAIPGDRNNTFRCSNVSFAF